MKKKIIICLLFIIVIIALVLTSIMIGNKKNKNVQHENQIEKVASYNNPKIPKGFKKVETETASWELNANGEISGWNNGLIIEDEIGNQFVWVPYINEEYKNKDYISSDNEEEIQLFQYGGFYIARFECGVPEEIQSKLNDIDISTNNIVGKPVSKKNVKPWNYIDYNNANQSANLMYDSQNLKSSLVSLNKFEILIDWLKNSGYDVENSSSWGNYSDAFFKFSGIYSNDLGVNYQFVDNMKKSDNVILGTGVIDRNIANNIYDIAGNLREYTCTQFEDTEYHFSIGGYWGMPGNDNGNYAAKEKYAYAKDAGASTGFRVCLNMYE